MATENIIVRLAMEARDYIRGAGQAEKATAGITKSAANQSKGLKGLVAQYGGLAKAAAGAFAAKQVVDFASSSVRAFSDLQESLNAVEVGFGESADTIKAFGETAAETVGLSNSQFNQLSVTTGALLSNFIDDADAAAEETIKLTERASDMASVFNTSVPDALGAVQAALRGETEPARRFGVLLDDMTIRSRAVELGLAATTSEVDRQAKGLAALDLIYEQTEKTAGDFANTSDDMANKQRILTARFEDAKAEIGEALVPVWDALLDVGEAMLPLLPAIAEAIAGVAEKVADLVGWLEPLVGYLDDVIGFAFGMDDSFTTMKAGVEGAAEAMAQITDATDGVISAISGAVTENANYRTSLIDAANAADAEREAINNNALAAARAAKKRAAHNESVETAAEVYGRYADKIRDSTKAQLEAASPVFALLEAQKRVKEAIDARAAAEKDGGTETDAYKSATADLLEAQLGLEAATANAKGRIGEAEDALSTAATQVGITNDEVEDLIQSLDDLPTVTNLSVNVRFNQTGSPPPPPPPPPPNVSRYAHGGDFSAGQAMMVGELGPEILIPSHGGTVIPNNQIGGNTVQVFMESGGGDTFDQVSLALQMAGITETIEWAGSSTLRG